MASGRAADREDPKKSKRRAARSLDRDPISELIRAKRSDAPHQRAGHMTAPDRFAEAELNILRRRGPSTYGFCISIPARSPPLGPGDDQYRRCVIRTPRRPAARPRSGTGSEHPAVSRLREIERDLRLRRVHQTLDSQTLHTRN